MKKRLLSLLISLSILLSLVPAVSASAEGAAPPAEPDEVILMADEEEFPETLTIYPNNGNRLPSWIDLTKDPSGAANKYHLYLPGNANLVNCFLSWEGGMVAEYDGREYDSGQLPIPSPGETATYVFTKGSETKTFDVKVFQGSLQVRPIFIEIDESQGTIAAMNSDRNHQTTCVGQIIIDGKRMNLPQIKGRGNYSWQQAKEKRPYNFKLDNKVNLLGIDSEKTKKWSLLANTNDHTLLRNKVAYDLAHAMGIGLDSTSVDMWMNGQYQGVYLLTPKTDSFVTDDGFLVENNNYAETIPISEGGDPTFYVGSSNESVSAGGGGGMGGFPGGGWGMGSNGGLLTNIKGIGDKLLEGGEETPEAITAAAKTIRAYLEDAWAALKTNDGYNSKQQYYTEFFDMPTTAAMYLLHEYVKNLEVQGGSIFFHRDGQTSADKLKGGPAWDYDNALAFNGTSFGGWGGGGGGSQQNSYQRLDGWYITGQNRSGLLGSLGKHQDLLDETYRIYNIYYRAFDDVCQNLLREADKIEQSAEMNFARFTKETMNAFDVSSDKTIGAGTEWEITYKKTDTWRDYIENLYRYTEGRARYFKVAMYDEEMEHGYGAIFEQGAYSNVTVYDTQELSGGTQNPDVAYARDPVTGEIDTSGEGKIYFKVDTAEGCDIDTILVEPAANYASLTPVAGKTNVYCLSGVTGSVIITVRAATISQTTFVCDEGVSIDVLKTQSEAGTVFPNVTSAFPRNSSTGEIDVSGDGQVNFIVKLAEGYELQSVTAEPTGNYKNLKGPSDTEIPNGYRLTKVTGDVTVTVKAVKTDSGECEHDYQAVVTPATCTAQGFTTYTCSKCGDSYVDKYTDKIPHDYKNGVCTVCGEKLLNVTFSCGAGATVTVLETQSAEGPKAENVQSTNPRNGDTGLIDCSGEGQVNFIVKLAEGYVLDGVIAGPTGSYKNLKGPEETGIENGYRITKVTGDLTVNITAKKSGNTPCDHDYKSVVTAPTCTEKGYTTYTCTKCGDSYTGDEVAALGHDWDGGTVTAEPTETATGVRTYTCRRCGETKTESIPALGHKHDYKAVVTPPTCTEKGFTTYTCACGDSYTGDEVAALGHDFKDGVCTRCGEADPNYVPPVDRTALDQAIGAAEAIKAESYTSESFAALSEALEAAKAVPVDADQATVDAAAAAVNKAIEDLQPAADKADKRELAKAIAAAEAVDPEKYESVEDLNKALEAAKTVNDKEDATQDEVNAASAALNKAMEELKEKEPVAPPVEEPFRFDDVKNEKSFYFQPVYWAYEAKPQITNGLDKTHFGPDAGCTRGQVVTFLWRAAGCPEPQKVETAFTDVGPKAFYAKAVAWAVEKGITKGMSDTTFAPDDTCTRGQIVTFLWRFRESPDPQSTETKFTDVSPKAFYAKAVAWAVENDVTKGMTENTFAPNDTCTRGQIVTFLYRATAE